MSKVAADAEVDAGLVDEAGIEDEVDAGTPGEQDSPDEEVPGDLVIEIEGEDPPVEDAPAEEIEAAPKWVRDVRAKNRELEKQVRELKRAAPKPAEEQKPSAPVVGEKPTLEGCEYDADDFEQKLLSWNESKRKAEDFQREQAQAADKQKAAWDAELSRYGTLKAELQGKLKVDDFDDVEARVVEALSADQQAIIVRGATNPAAMVHAIGRNPKVLADLAGIKDIAKFAVEIGKLETRVKVTQRKPTTQPEEVIRGNGGSALSGSPGKQLDKLRADAEKTGDYSKVVQFKKQMSAQK